MMTTVNKSAALNHNEPSMNVSGIPVRLVSAETALDQILGRFHGEMERPLGVVSVNLDHLHHFGNHGQWSGTLHADHSKRLDWLYLADGAPIVAEARRILRQRWPRLAGSDLAEPVLKLAEQENIRVAFLGGSEENRELLARKLKTDFPGLRVVGLWSPDRGELESPERSRALAQAVREAGAQLLFIGLGKPRQELWMAEYGLETGASVLLGFGAVVDFLAGTVQRAPAVLADYGLEWAWRLLHEPRRLAQRYLIQGPAAYLELRRGSSQAKTQILEKACRENFASLTPGVFTGPKGHVDCEVIVVTYNNAAHIGGLLNSLRAETDDLTIRVHVADNSSTDETLARVTEDHPDVLAFATGGNFGYAAAINISLSRAGNSETVLILNPDVTVRRGSTTAMINRMHRSRAGVVVPQLLDEQENVTPSIFHEPSLARALGDALFGAYFSGRSAQWAGMDYSSESYAYSRPIHAARGAALMLRRAVAEAIPWDESYFLYSEEVDFFRKVADTGESVWYEPEARVVHLGGASESSPRLDALRHVNRIRYVRQYHSAPYAALFRAAIVLERALRYWKPGSLTVLRALIDESRWAALPGPIPDHQESAGQAVHRLPAPLQSAEPDNAKQGDSQSTRTRQSDKQPLCAVIIPAHNEAAVIHRALDHLREVAATGEFGVIVACNGCTDETALIARSYAGVKVLELDTSSKTAALNAADAVTSTWPRIYMDADIEVSPSAIRDVCRTLQEGALAARPVVHFDVEGAHPLIRSFYRAKQRLPSVQQALWAGGIYALCEQGHARVRQFPQVTADDLFIDRLFTAVEKRVVDCDPVIFYTPRTVGDHLAVLHRVYRGNAELNGPTKKDRSSRRTLQELIASVQGTQSAVDALVYLGFAVAGRANGSGGEWERDESSRRQITNS